MQALKGNILKFNRQINGYSRARESNIRKLLLDIQKDLSNIFADIGALNIKKQNKEILIRTLLGNIEQEKDRIHSSMEIFSSSKPYLEILRETEEMILIKKNEIKNKVVEEKPDNEEHNKNVDGDTVVDIPDHISKSDNEDISNEEEVKIKANNVRFSEIEEYLQLDIDPEEITETNRKEIIEEYTQYIASIKKKTSENILHIIKKYINKLNWRQKDFLIDLKQLLEKNLKKDEKKEKIEDILKKLNELRRNKDKRDYEITLLRDSIIPENEIYKKKIMGILEDFDLKDDFYIKEWWQKEIKDQKKVWNELISKIKTIIDEWDWWFRLNMFNKYVQWDMSKHFKNILEEIKKMEENQNFDMYSPQKYKKFKERIYSTIDKFNETMEERKQEIILIYQQIEKNIILMEKSLNADQENIK